MNSFYLIRQDDIRITTEDFCAMLANLPGVQNLQTQDVFLAAAEADFIYKNDQTIIRLDTKQEIITITGTGEASIEAAYGISRRFPYPLRMFDMDYSFDIQLNDITSVAQLRARMSGSE